MGGDVAAREYIDDGMASVEGWFDETEARAFVAVHRTQVAAGVHGDVLEVGAYVGKSAILLGCFVGTGERLVVSDLFGVPASDLENRREMDRFYDTYSLEAFVGNFGRFHDWSPTILRGPSAATLPNLPAESCRLVHVDGSHNFEAVRADAEEARRLLLPGGVVIFDDMFAVHAPGVQAAVWDAVSDGLVPIAIGTKLYGSWAPEAFDREAFARELAAMDGVVVAGTNRIRGHEVLEFGRDPAWRLPSKLRRGLDLLTPPAVPRLARRVTRIRRRVGV